MITARPNTDQPEKASRPLQKPTELYFVVLQRLVNFASLDYICNREFFAGISFRGKTAGTYSAKGQGGPGPSTFCAIQGQKFAWTLTVFKEKRA